MRSSSKSRNRNRNGNRRGNTGGNIINRVFESAGPEGKVRGTPQQIIDKYTSLAHDYQLSGDRVAAENFQQHAEHYSRMLAIAQRELAERQTESGASAVSLHVKPSSPSSSFSEQKVATGTVDNQGHINGRNKIDASSIDCSSDESQESDASEMKTSKKPLEQNNLQAEVNTKDHGIKKVARKRS